MGCQKARDGLRGDAVNHIVVGLEMDVNGLVAPADLDNLAVQRASLLNRPDTALHYARAARKLT